MSVFTSMCLLALTKKNVWGLIVGFYSNTFISVEQGLLNRSRRDQTLGSHASRRNLGAYHDPAEHSEHNEDQTQIIYQLWRFQ